MTDLLRSGTPEIRPAAPVDPDRFARLIWETDPHIFAGLHGHDQAMGLRHLAAQWQTPAGLFSHAHATGAWLGKTMVGLELGYTAAQQAAALDPHMETAAKTVQPDELAAMSAWWQSYGMFNLPMVPEDAYYLQTLAVDPSVRGRGIGEQLLMNAIGTAAATGLKRLHLDVFEGNPSVSLYERMGLDVIVETRVRALDDQGFPLHLRMEILL